MHLHQSRPLERSDAVRPERLDVTTIAFIPYVFFAWTTILIQLIFGFASWTLSPLADSTPVGGTQ